MSAWFAFLDTRRVWHMLFSYLSLGSTPRDLGWILVSVIGALGGCLIFDLF